MNRYKKLKFVGEGSFARVYKVLDKKSQQIVALKCIKKDGKSEVEIEKLMEEIMILQSLSHKNIIKIMEWFVTESEICVVTEFAEKGELFKIIKKKKPNRISELDIKLIAKQLVAALQFLHESRVIHRDIKPQNILLSADNTIKLCDFGFARALSEESTMATSIKGTPLYMAPELVQEKPYNHTVDLWSLGVILYELFYGKPPFYTNSIYKLVRMIVKDHIKYPPHPVISKQFQHFINGLLQKNPQKRFNIVHLHKHIFLQNTPNAPHNPSKATATATATYSATYLKQIHYQKRIKPAKSSPYLQLKANPYSMKPQRTPCSDHSEKENRFEEKEEEIVNAEHADMDPETHSSSSSTTTTSSSNASIISFKEATDHKQSAGNTVRQKVLEILDSNDWDMIHKILIVLPQRWQSFCSLSNGNRYHFEIKLFNKLYILLSATQNVTLLANIIHVMCLIMDRIRDTQHVLSLLNIIRNVYRHYVCNKYMNCMQLFPMLCRFIKVTMSQLKDTAPMDDGCVSLLISNLTKYEEETIHDVIDIVCAMMQYRPLHVHIANTDTLQLNAFSTLCIAKIPFLTFWKNIESHIEASLDAFFGAILKPNGSTNALRFILCLVMTSGAIRDHLIHNKTFKESLISHVSNTDMSPPVQLDALLLVYYLNTNELEPAISHTLHTLCATSCNVFISNLSRALLIRAPSVDSKPILQTILTFITNKNQKDLNQIVFETNGNNDNNIFDCWCHCLCTIRIDDNIKLSITIALQWFNILSKRIQYIVNRNNTNHDTDNKMLIISAHSLNTFLTFLHQILQRLMTQKASNNNNNNNNIDSHQKTQLIKEFVSPKHIQTLSILGNPQFVLQYMSHVPFHLDTLYTDLIQCCNVSYSCILCVYRYLASEYSRQHVTPRTALSPSPSPSFHMHRHDTGYTKLNKRKDDEIDDKWIYNFHKITLQLQLISSILNYIQISPPPQKEEACNLLFYITWKQSLFMKEFLTLNGLWIVTNCIIKQRKHHSDNIIIQVLQIISCTARKYKSFYDKIECTGIFQLIPKYLLSDNESLEIKEKICNLVGNLCKHSDNFLDVIRAQNLLQILCQCTENKLSSNIRRFACYAIGNIAYQSTKQQENVNGLIICVKPLSLRLCDKDYKTQENAAGAIGNLVSSQNNQCDGASAVIMNEIVKHNVIKLLLDEIAMNMHLCVVRNCLYSLSNMCYAAKCRKLLVRVARNEWRQILKHCLLKYGNKDPFVKKCVFKILRKMANETAASF